MGSAVLDTAIGLAFAFFVLSLVCSGIMESIANALNKRASFLLRGLRQLLDGAIDKSLERQSLVRTKPRGANPTSTAAAKAVRSAANQPTDAPITLPAGGLTEALFGHPLIHGLKRPSYWRAGGLHNPSYIPATTVSRALLDALLPTDRTNTATEFTAAVSRLPEGLPGRNALLALARDAGTDIDRFRANIEEWYDEQMRRVSGWYKRWTKKWLIALGLVIAIVFNIDAIALGQSLYRDEPLRSAVVAQAVSADACPAAGDGNDAARQECIRRQREALAGLGLPVGWASSNRPTDTGGWLLKILGWLVTAAAASLGAPFWFDALGRLGSWRNTGPRPTPAT